MSSSSIRVAWNDVGRELPPFLLDVSNDVNGTVVVDKHSTTNITNRFLPLPLETQAIFHTDDDVLYDCRQLWAAFLVWKDNPYRLVGFAPRFLTVSGYFWGAAYQSESSNTVFITKGGFLHHRLHKSFFHPSLNDVRDKVNTYGNGEDLMMSFVAAAIDSDVAAAVPLLKLAPPKGEALDCPHDMSSISDRPYFKAERTDILKALVEKIGFSLKTVRLANFHHFDNGSGRFLSFRETCGHQHILNPMWLYCVSRIRRTKKHGWV